MSEPGGESSALLSYLKALALEAAGRDDEAELARLSGADTTTALGRDLAGAAIIRRGARALARGEDARALLETVPAGSRYASRARHMRGLVALEHGDVDQGRRILASLLADDSSYAARRQVSLGLAGRFLDEGRWDAAHEAHREIEQDWTRHHEMLRRILAEGSFDALWSSWEGDPFSSDALRLDALPARMLAERLAADPWAHNGLLIVKQIHPWWIRLGSLASRPP